MTETVKIYCNWCGKDKEGRVSRSSDGKIQGVFYECADCNKDAVLVTWGQSGGCP